MVEMSRRHNNVNVLCLPGDMIGERPIDDLVLMWLNTDFDGGRHAQRVQKISEIEQQACDSRQRASSSLDSTSDLISRND